MTVPNIPLSNFSMQDDGTQSLCLWCYGLGHTLLHCPHLFRYDYESEWQTDQEFVANSSSPVRTHMSIRAPITNIKYGLLELGDKLSGWRVQPRGCASLGDHCGRR